MFDLFVTKSNKYTERTVRNRVFGFIMNKKMNHRHKFADCYDMVCLFGGLVFFAPVALLVRTQAGVSESEFFLLQALLSCITALGEVPFGHITDKIGYKNSLILYQALLLIARALLFAAFLSRSLLLFVVEAVVEGAAFCFASGTSSAYLYELHGEEGYLAKSTRAGNFSTAGFIISTLSYVLIYDSLGLQGLLAATVISGAICFTLSFFTEREPQKTRNTGEHAAADTEKPLPFTKNIAVIFKNKHALLYACMLSLFGIAWLLVNFFYADKLIKSNVPVEWLSAIIIAYSAIQMLAEPIINRAVRPGAKLSRLHLTVLSGIICGAAFAIFGALSSVVLVISAMLLIPLMLSIPEYFIGELENKIIDQLELKDNRAASLSMMNIGVNLVQVVSFFAASVLTKIGIGWCFAFCGISIIACSLAMLLNRRKSTADMKEQH